MPWWATRAQIGTTTIFLGIVAMAQMWNLLAGFGGLVSIGQQAFIGLGSYVAVIIALQGGVSIYFAVPARGTRVRRRGVGASPSSSSGCAAPISPSAPGSSPNSCASSSPTRRASAAGPESRSPLR